MLHGGDNVTCHDDGLVGARAATADGSDATFSAAVDVEYARPLDGKRTDVGATLDGFCQIFDKSRGFARFCSDSGRF